MINYLSYNSTGQMPGLIVSTHSAGTHLFYLQVVYLKGIFDNKAEEGKSGYEVYIIDGRKKSIYVIFL
jgi:hypothetical protein